MKNDLQILIDNLLDIWATIDPRRIITKVKLHVLAHLPDDIRRFGPAVIFAMEIFECFNAVFRMCSVLSNHLAPSRDIAITLADMERFKHLVSGGYWKDDNGRYIRAGLRVQNFLQKNPELQRHLGWADETLLHAGDLFLHGSKDILLTRTGTVKCAPPQEAVPINLDLDYTRRTHLRAPSIKCRLVLPRNNLGPMPVCHITVQAYLPCGCMGFLQTFGA